MKPLVSVVIPTYNSEKTIIECLESVRLQTYNKLEIIIVNDGSIDNTLKILKIYKSKYPDFNLNIFTIKNSGPSAARNFGINQSHGEFIAFLDSDDKWVPEKIEKQIACFINNPNIHLLGCETVIGKIKHYSKPKIIYISKYQLLFKNYFHTPCVIIRREVLNKMKFNESQKYSEDYYLWLQIAFENYTCAKLNEVLTILYDKPIYGSSGLSAKLTEMEKGELTNYQTLYHKHKISYPTFIITCGFSYFKFMKRKIYSYLRNHL